MLTTSFARHRKKQVSGYDFSYIFFRIAVILIFTAAFYCRLYLPAHLIFQNSSSVSGENILTLFEGYHDELSMSMLHTSRKCYVPILLQPLEGEEEDGVASVPNLLPSFRNSSFSGLFSEYAAIFAMPALSQTPWVGYISSRAAEKGFQLSEIATLNIEDFLHQENLKDEKSAFLYWGEGSENLLHEMTSAHGRGIVNAFGAAFHLLFLSEDKIDVDGRLAEASNSSYFNYFPDVPPILPGHWSYASHFIMRNDSLAEYVEFSRKFATALESLWNVLGSFQNCPVDVSRDRFSQDRCWGFVLERLVNLWVYHRGIRMFLVDQGFGVPTEKLPVADRKVSPMFSSEALNRLSDSFPSRLSCRAQRLYGRFGGKLKGNDLVKCMMKGVDVP